MSTSSQQQACAARCWKIAALAGVGVAVLLIAFGGWLWWKAIVIGVVVFSVGGVALRRLWCRDDVVDIRPASAAAQFPDPTQTQTAPQAPAQTREPAPASKGEAEPKKAPQTPADEPNTGADAVTIRPSAVLPGQQELAARKGSWKYTTAPVDAEPLLETDPDDLKKISGIGPALEQKLHGAGVTTFAQIAGWNGDDVARMDDVLSFRGRITRDNWIEQAGILAAGGETEFSGRNK